MKSVAVCGLFVFLSSGLFAQRHVGSSAGTNAGYGNVVFPGGRPAITTPFTQTNRSFATSLGNVVAGRPAFNNGGARRNQNSGAVVYVPYGYPVYGGGYYGGNYGGYGEGGAPPQQPPQNITIIYPPQPQPMMMVGPQVQSPGGQIREYTSPEPASADTAPVQRDADYYLLAFKDHSIYSAVGYWVDGDTVHYITTGNVHNQVSVSLIDRELTAQLNKGRGMQITLPASR